MTTTIKNFPEILYFDGYTKRPVDFFNRPIRNIEIYIPFANIISISKHKTRYHRYNLFYYCILLRNGTKIYINHKNYCKSCTGIFSVTNWYYEYLETLLSVLKKIDLCFYGLV